MPTVRRKPAAPSTPATKVVDDTPPPTPQAQAERLIPLLRSDPAPALLAQARALLPALRGVRAFAELQRLAEAVCRADPVDAAARCQYAQALIETGAATAAIDMLRQLRATLPPTQAEWAEASGLLGRAFKQIFFDAGAPGHAGARWALESAIEAYAEPYRAAPERATWQGVNLLALVSRARIEGWADVAPAIDPLALAVQLTATLRALPKKSQDDWYLPTLAEATLGLSLATGDLKPVEELLARYIGRPDVQAFQVASTLRQFTEVWGLEALGPHTRGIGLKGEAALARARRLCDVLRARLLQLPGGQFSIPAAAAAVAPAPARAAAPAGKSAKAGKAKLQAAADSAHGQLENILGVEGPQTFAWWRAGIESARSVAVVRQRLGKRMGTGFLVSAGDFGLAPADELLFLTNFHVINSEGAPRGMKPADAEVVFEAADAGKAYAVGSVVWSSPITEHDACLLRLKQLPEGIPPLPISTELPALPPAGAKKVRRPRVYIIGYPGGRELSFSFQDNELIDHEGPPTGQPQTPGVVRVHYFAPTEGGNSGSPVFEDSGWRVIALHHSGGNFGMPRLNGVAGTYAANEGLALARIAEAVRAAQG